LAITIKTPRNLNQIVKIKLVKSMTGIIGISLGTSTAAVPYLQTTALNAVKKAVIARGGVTLTVNSALRTLPQQLSFCFVYH
jgi:hypothetical protein